MVHCTQVNIPKPIYIILDRNYIKRIYLISKINEKVSDNKYCRIKMQEEDLIQVISQIDVQYITLSYPRQILQQEDENRYLNKNSLVPKLYNF